MNQRYTLSHTEAAKVIDTIRQELEKEGRGAAIAVVDSHGELIAFLRTDNCPLASINNAINKAFTAARERKESAQVGQSSREKGFPLSNFGDMRYIGWGGGIPITYEGQVLGAVGVSGLPEEDDIIMARIGSSLL